MKPTLKEELKKLFMSLADAQPEVMRLSKLPGGNAREPYMRGFAAGLLHATSEIEYLLNKHEEDGDA